MTKVHRPCPGGTSGCADIIRMLTFPAVVALGQPENPNLGEKNTHTRLLRGSRADFLVSPPIIIYFPSLKKAAERRYTWPQLSINWR